MALKHCKHVPTHFISEFHYFKTSIFNFKARIAFVPKPELFPQAVVNVIPSSFFVIAVLTTPVCATIHVNMKNFKPLVVQTFVI